MLAGLILILIVMIGLSGLHIAPVGGRFINLNVDGLIEDWHYILSGEPGELLYIATYDDFLEDWEIYDDGRLSSQVIDGKLRIAALTSDSLPFSITRQHFGDFDLRVETQVIDGPLDNGFGIVFRFQDSFNLYRFLISSDGFYQVVRTIDGEEKSLSAWADSSLINQGIGARNTLRVVAHGDRFQFYINDALAQVCIPDDPNGVSTFAGGQCVGGQMRDVLIDDSFASGRLGMMVMTFSEPGVAVDFDNVLVFASGVLE